ncbi:hypothetical protein ABPG77_007633 [Micractinium sp. CCAP 211/92]
MSRALLALGLLALAALASAAKIQLPCERITGISGCVECRSSPTKECYLCQRTLSPVWTPAGKMCKATSVGAACKQTSGDPNCVRCDGTVPQWCTECKVGTRFNANYKCIAGTCPQYSRNAGCAANGCTPDGTCARCARAGMFLVPANAVYINAQWSDTLCMTLANLNKEATTLTGKNAVVPAGCVSVDTLFRCNQCKAGMSLTGGKCVPVTTTGNKCKATVPYREYCSKCNAAGTACTVCNGNRMAVNGACNLPCKQMFGIGCLACTPNFCTRADPAFLNGRR